ncbi:MAG TPA: GTPase [Pirellulales bacterium]|nr:GTPase [Pirellulales bacterium]
MTRRTKAAVLTPEGRGAVATVLVEGPEATQTVGRLFHSAAGKPLASYPLGAIAFGRWHSAEGEELVVSRLAEHRVEIHCHGGKAAVAAILDSLRTANCAVLSWSELLAQPGGDRIQSQAAEALASATTDRTAAILLDQFNGALASALADVLCWLSYNDDASLVAAQSAIAALESRIPLGRHLTQPFRIVLAGRPNVGKSSLINALVGYRRSIVYDQPGTTRDVVTAATALDGWPVEFADTAGIRAAQESLEQQGILRAQARLASADLRVLVFDGSCDWSPADRSLLESWPNAVVVHNKADLHAVDQSPRPSGIFTSALTLSGIDELIQALVVRLAPAPPAPGSAVPFHESHFQAIALAAESLARGDRQAAAAALRSIL